MQRKTYTKGYSLVEVLVSISVLLIAIVGPMTIASQGIKSSRFALEQNTAFFLAQEGIEAVFAIRGNQALAEQQAYSENSSSATDTAWDWLQDLSGTCSTNFSSAGDACSLGIDFRDDTPIDNLTSNECDAGNESNCLLYKDALGARGVYTHNGSAVDASPYTRIITIERVGDGVVQVDVSVRWESQIFVGNEQRVDITSVLHDTSLDLNS